MKLNTSWTGLVVSVTVAGLIYLIIALATGADVGHAVIGAVIVMAIATAIGTAFRIYHQRSNSTDALT